METLRRGILATVTVVLFMNVSDGQSAGQSCYSCDFVDDLSSCNNTTQCSSDEMCYVHEFTSYGETRYRMGCVNKKYCASGNPMVGRRQADNQTVCSVCCDADNCNVAACGSTQTGNIYSLSLLAKEGSCSDKSDETCAAFGQLNKGACALTHVSNTCPRSCSLCEHFGWGTWTSWGKCSRTCNPGLRVRYRKCEGQLDNLQFDGTCSGVSTETDPCLVTWCQMMASSSPTLQGQNLMAYVMSMIAFIFLNKHLCMYL